MNQNEQKSKYSMQTPRENFKEEVKDYKSPTDYAAPQNYVSVEKPKRIPPTLTLDKINRQWRITHTWMCDVFKYMQVSYNNKEVIQDVEKAKNHFETFMGDKLKANLRVRFDSARSVVDMKAAIKGVLLEEWPLIRNLLMCSVRTRITNLAG